MSETTRTEDERLWAALAHASIIILWIIGPLIVYLVKKDESYWVGRQAMQALFYQIGTTVAVIALSILSMIVGIILSAIKLGAIGAIFGCLWPILILGAVIYGLYGAYMCYKGTSFKYVVVGNMVSGL
jgi:uncharacterized protein